MNPREGIADLSLDELKTLIRQTVQEAVAEVLVEFSIAAERDTGLMAQAELMVLLRNSLGTLPSPPMKPAVPND